MLKEVKLKKFLKQNEKEINELMQKQVELFNKIGELHNDTSLQLAFTGVIIYAFLKSSNIEKKEKIRLLKNVEKQVKKE